jgi:hypothetical protein
MVAWCEAAPKFRRRVGITRQLGLGLTRSALAFKVMCVPILSFTLQLHPVSPALLHMYKEAVMYLTAGPRNSLSYDLCTQLSSFHLPVEFQDLQTLARATCLRYVIRSSTFSITLSRLEALRDERESIFVRFCSGWWNSSFLAYMRRLYEWYFSLPRTPSSPSPPTILARIPSEHKKLQHLLYGMLWANTSRREHPHSILQRRIQKWFPLVQREMVDRFFINAHYVIQKTQPYMIVSLLRFLSRSVCTSTRFHSAAKGCLLGCPHAQGRDLDSVAHYARCPRLFHLFHCWFGHILPPSSSIPEGYPWLFPALLLSPSPRSSNVLFAACIDAFLAAHSARRKSTPGTPAEHFEARLRVTARRHPFLSRAWSQQAAVQFSSSSSSSPRVRVTAAAAEGSQPGRATTGRGRWLEVPEVGS